MVTSSGPQGLGAGLNADLQGFDVEVSVEGLGVKLRLRCEGVTST
jgi:hypothetical protein